MARLITPSAPSSPRYDFSSLRGSWSVRSLSTRHSSPTFASPQRNIFTVSKPQRAPFQQQLSREAHKWWLLPTNDQRFSLISDPQISTKHKKVVSPNMRKALSRKQPCPSTQLRYEPRYAAIWAKVPVTDFKATSGRKAQKQSQALDYSVHFDMVNPHTQAARLSERPEALLPAHMVQGTSRMALTVLQQRSLVMNSFPFS